MIISFFLYSYIFRIEKYSLYFYCIYFIIYYFIWYYYIHNYLFYCIKQTYNGSYYLYIVRLTHMWCVSAVEFHTKNGIFG